MESDLPEKNTVIDQAAGNSALKSEFFIEIGRINVYNS